MPSLADFLTIKEEFKDFENVTLTFIGDGNNVANSLILSCCLLGIEIRIACPKGYEPNPSILKKTNEITGGKSLLKIMNNPYEAVVNSNVLYTDVWSSMGEENNKTLKDKDFKGFVLNQKLVENASKDAIILHCLPAYRKKEITDEVIEGERSRVFDQRE